MTSETTRRGVLCECVNVKTGATIKNGTPHHNFILDLSVIETGQTLIKFLPCNSSTKGRFTVPHGSDFVKLYNLTLGGVPKKRFSEAHHLARHFLNARFYAEYESARDKNNKHYLRVTHIEPERYCKSDSFTASGVLKKTRKNTAKPPPKLPDDYRTSTGQTPDDYRTNTGQTPDEKTLQGSKTLGLEPVFNPIIPSKIEPSNIRTCTHVDDEFFLNYPPAAFEFYSKELHNLIHGFGFDEDEATEHALEQVRRQFVQLAPPPNHFMAGTMPSYTHH